MRWSSVAVLAVVAAFEFSSPTASAADEAKWIWFDDGKPGMSAPAGNVWFRYTIKSPQPCTGQLTVACDNHFVLWVNGKRMGEGDFRRPYRFNLAGQVDAGTNVIAIEARNDGGAAGLYVDGALLHPRHVKEAGYNYEIHSGADWLATRDEPKGDAWLGREFDATSWKPAKVVAKSHADTPWRKLVLDGEQNLRDRYEMPEGFEIERIAEPELAGSLINMTWGNRGRLLVSQERGPLLNLIDTNADGVYDEATEYSATVTNCQGMCMVFDTLYAVGNGPDGVGMYRLPDRDADDKADGCELIVLHEGVKAGSAGRIGDHGPHDVVLGPDGWLYHNMGNHARITHKAEPTSGVVHYYEGNLLEPRFEDARGHDGGGNPVPAGSVWRFTPDGKKWWLESVGYRNQFDVAFNADGELFTFDADMEWDVGTPWYRPCRVNHCVPGAEFGWRSGTAKWPAYYFDSLPETVDVGRGSPTGVVMYEHHQFPEKYCGCLLMCDWSRGRILSVKLSPKGATYAGEVETLVAGNPLNASDIEVDRDGTMIFCTGGRNSEGGVYRVRFGGKDQAIKSLPEDALAIPQIHAAWAREAISKIKARSGDKWASSLTAIARSGQPAEQVRALTLLSQFGPKPSETLLSEVARDTDAHVRAFAIWLLGDHASGQTATVLADALRDKDARVRRRACEAFVRTGLEAPVDELLPLLSHEDRWLRYASREALKRVPVDKWRERIKSVDRGAAFEIQLAQYQIGDKSFSVVAHGTAGIFTARRLDLDSTRLLQLAVISQGREPFVNSIGGPLLSFFPSGDTQLDIEVARLIAVLNPPGTIDKLLAMLSTGSQEDQLHYALCLRYVDKGWTYDQRVVLLDWYEKTKTWEGGSSFAPFLENIAGASFASVPAQERVRLIEAWRERPHATRILIAKSNTEQMAAATPAIEKIIGELYTQRGSVDSSSCERDALLDAAIGALGSSSSPEVLALLRKLYDENPDRRNELARVLAQHPTLESWPYLMRTLSFGDFTTLQLCVGALTKIDRKPETAADYRAAILAGLQIHERGGVAVANLLAKWTGIKHPDSNNGKRALATYQQWFHETYPQEPAAELPKNDPSKSRYTLGELVKYLDSPAGKAGNVARGKQVFAKANCIKCHQFLSEGQGIGPDLTSVRRRFQRKEIVESIVQPSKVISDQYRSVTVQTTAGLVYTGMPVKQPGDDKLVLLLPDATKLEIASGDIDETTVATISVMPENLLAQFSLGEVADLFAFLETSKNNDPALSKPAAATAGAGR